MKYIWLTVFCCLGVFARGQDSLVDPSFEVGSGTDGAVYDLGLQKDGNILVGGSFKTISGQPLTNLARLLPNGHLDSSFSNAVTDGTVYSIGQQSDGRIIVAGDFTQLQGEACAGLGRLRTDGAFDPSFNSETFSSYSGIPFKTAIQPDDKIVVSFFNGTFEDPQLVRLNADGTLDGHFAQTNVFDNYYPHGLLVCSNGSIFVGGGFTGANDFASPGLVLLNSSGLVDTNFQSGLSLGSDVFAIVPQADGGYLIGGVLTQTNGSPTVVMQRLASDLKWDTNFVTSSFNADSYPQNYITSAFVQPDGKIVVGGSFYDVGGYWRRHIARLNTDGKVDPCFDPGIGLGDFYGAYVVRPQPDGKVLVGGQFGIPGYVPSNIARLLPQSDCDATRAYLEKDGSGGFYAAGTTPPGGTNFLQSSTNLIDWTNVVVDTNSYLVSPVNSTAPAAFFRVKKVY